MQIVKKDINNDLNDKEEKRLYSNFIYSIKTEVSRQMYIKCLKYYMKFLGVNTLKALIDKPQKIIESDIKEYLIYLRNQKKISYITASLYLSAIRKFYYVNSDHQFKWDLITSYLGNDDTDEDNNDTYESSNNNNSDLTEGEQQDRPYSKKEIKQMFNAAQDIRVKIIISLMISSGLRYGAVNILKTGDLEKIEKFNLYKITAYRKSKKFKCYTFCSPECSTLIDTYLSYRKNQGEILKSNSPLIREQFNTNDKLKVNNPRHLTLVTFRSLINDVLTKYTNLRKKLDFDYENRRKEGRNPTMLTHGMRKYFTVECTKAGVYHEIVEKMLGHQIPGSRRHYLIFDPQTLLEGTAECKGYVAALDALTINDENRLQKQVKELKEQDNYNKYIIDKKMKEKDEEIAKIKQAMRTITDQIDIMKNELIAKQTKKLGKVKKIEDDFKKMESHLFETEIFAQKLDEVNQKREEIFAKKGFVTKEDEELIKNSILDDIKQNEPGLWQTLSHQQQQQQ